MLDQAVKAFPNKSPHSPPLVCPHIWARVTALSPPGGSPPGPSSPTLRTGSTLSHFDRSSSLKLLLLSPPGCDAQGNRSTTHPLPSSYSPLLLLLPGAWSHPERGGSDGSPGRSPSITKEKGKDVGAAGEGASRQTNISWAPSPGFALRADPPDPHQTQPVCAKSQRGSRLGTIYLPSSLPCPRSRTAPL